MDQETVPCERPTTAKALVLIWAERDDQYARLVKPLTDEQIAAVQRGRERETMFLPVEERARYWAKANAWYPPEHGQGLS